MVLVAALLLTLLLVGAFVVKMAYNHWGRPLMLMKWYQNTL